MATVSERVIDIIEQMTGHSDLTDNTSLEDLSLDSLDQVEIVMELEEEFDISIPDGEIERVKTIGDIVKGIEQEHKILA